MSIGGQESGHEAVQRGSSGTLSQSDIESLDFAKAEGLLPVIVQHATTGAVLMLGYMNREALRETFSRGHVVFFSRSKQRLWEKGETSGNFLQVTEVRADCDRDALLITAHPQGPVCHTGMATCFGDEPATVAEHLAFLSLLEAIVEQRIADSPQGSYTARLFSQGPTRIAQKVGEEGLEVALAAVTESDDKLLSEAADLIFHLLVLLKSRGLPFTRVVAELAARHAAKS